MVGRPARRPDRTTAVNSGRRRRRACAGNTSGGELLAALAATTGDDRAARTGAHPQPEAVGLGPTTVVRLERALAHEGLPLGQRMRTTVLHPAGRRAAGAGADGAALRTRKLVSADRPHRSAGRPGRGPLRGRQGPSTEGIQHSRGPAAAGGRDGAAAVADPPESWTGCGGRTQARRRTTAALRSDAPERATVSL